MLMFKVHYLSYNLLHENVSFLRLVGYLGSPVFTVLLYLPHASQASSILPEPDSLRNLWNIILLSRHSRPPIHHGMCIIEFIVREGCLMAHKAAMFPSTETETETARKRTLKFLSFLHATTSLEDVHPNDDQ